MFVINSSLSNLLQVPEKKHSPALKESLIKEFLQYLIEEYSEPVVGYPEDHRRLTLISRKEDVCKFIFYL